VFRAREARVETRDAEEVQVMEDTARDDDLQDAEPVEVESHHSSSQSAFESTLNSPIVSYRIVSYHCTLGLLCEAVLTHAILWTLTHVPDHTVHHAP